MIESLSNDPSVQTIFNMTFDYYVGMIYPAWSTINVRFDVAGNFMLGNLFSDNQTINNIVTVPNNPLDIAVANVVCTYIIAPFYYRVPYADLNTFSNRLCAILNKYSINIYNYIIKYIQLQNIQKLLNQNASKMLNYQTNTNTSINTSNSANEVGGTSFNPVTGGSVSVTMPKASSDDTINIDGIANAQASNSNYETNQQESQGTSHNLTEQSLSIYKQIKFEMDNCLQPILKAVNSLFYIFDQGDDYTW